MNGLVGYDLAGDKSLATLRRDDLRDRLGAGDDAGVAVDGEGRAPRRLHGRRADQRRRLRARGAGAVTSAASRCSALATAMIGVYNAIGLQYRFAAAEVATHADRAQGDLAGARRRHRRRRPRAGDRSALAKDRVRDAVRRHRSSCSRPTRWSRWLVQSRVHVPMPPVDRGSAGRRGRCRTIVRQPVFVVAVLSGALGYGIMNLLMTATPLAMDFCGHPYRAGGLRHRVACGRDVRPGARSPVR